QLDTHDRNQALADVITRKDGVLFLQQIVLFRVLVDRSRQRRPKPGQVCSAIGVGDRVGEAKDLIRVAVVVLKNAVDENLVLLGAQNDGFRMDYLLIAAKLPNKLLDARWIREGFPLVLLPLIGEHDLNARIQEGQFTQPVREDFELKLRRD